MRSFDGRPAVSVGATEQFALPRVHPGLRDARVWLGWFGPATRPLQAISAATALATKLPGVRGAIGAAAGRFVKGSTGGPDAATRARARSHIVAVASDAAGAPLATVRLEGDNPYDFTGAMLAWGAIAPPAAACAAAARSGRSTRSGSTSCRPASPRPASPARLRLTRAAPARHRCP